MNKAHEAAVRALIYVVQTEGPKRVPKTALDDTWPRNGSATVLLFSDDGDHVVIGAVPAADLDA